MADKDVQRPAVTANKDAQILKDILDAIGPVGLGRFQERLEELLALYGIPRDAPDHLEALREALKRRGRHRTRGRIEVEIVVKLVRQMMRRNKRRSASALLEQIAALGLKLRSHDLRPVSRSTLARYWSKREGVRRRRR